MDLSGFISYLKQHSEYRDAFVYHKRIPSEPAVYGKTPGFDERINSTMLRLRLKGLYCHQVSAIEHLRNGRNVLVSTPTASGKSLVYNLTIIEEILKNKNSRALYIFPLKALEQDQLKNLKVWLSGIEDPKISAEIYDGDTPSSVRQKIRSRPPQILFTNPDMLHRSLLAYHSKWQGFLGSLSFVILDEVHTYRGIFGSHLHQVIIRLKRLCRKYGANPQFILLSATISNPESFGENLVGEPVKIVDKAGAPRSGRNFMFFNPMASHGFSSARLFVDCIRKGFRTIVFTKSRITTELIHVWISQLAPDLARKTSSYRAGFMPHERRQIERKLSTGELLGVVSTSALEMGIDIGYLDVCILVGYPGTIINTWQRGGRVGRSGKDSLVILMAGPDALDQYFMKHPEDFFDRHCEAAVLDPYNTYVVREHLPCAANEIPISMDDTTYWKKNLEKNLEALEQKEILSRSFDANPVWYPSKVNPHKDVNLRSTGMPFTIFEVETGQAIGTISGINAFKECHPGAVYLHQSRQYVVDRLFIDKGDIIVSSSHLKYFTRVRSLKETEIMNIQRSKPEGQFVIRQGELKVTETITGYEKRTMPGQELMGFFPLDLPPQTFETIGFWIEIEPAIKEFIENSHLHFMGGIHAIEHAAIGIFPLFALCDRNDIGGICYPFHDQVGKSAIFIYDGHPGGVGLAARGFEIILDLLDKALELIKTCECEEGCPSCIHSPKCGAGNKPLDKKAAERILEGLLGYISLDQMVDQKNMAQEDFTVSPVDTPEPEIRPGPRIIYLDLETRKAAQDVGGWKNAHLMRISVLVIFDSIEDRYITYEEKDMDSLFEHLEKADLIVGFNIKQFDYKVMSAYTNKDLSTLPTFDILEDVHKRLGFRLGLDNLAVETLGKGKSSDGLQAILWFRQGEMKKLADYCMDDVAATRDLFLFGLLNHHLVYRKKNTDMTQRLLVDWDLKEIVKAA